MQERTIQQPKVMQEETVQHAVLAIRTSQMEIIAKCTQSMWGEIKGMKESEGQIKAALEGRLHGNEVEVKKETKDVQAEVDRAVEAMGVLKRTKQMEAPTELPEVEVCVDMAHKRLGQLQCRRPQTLASSSNSGNQEMSLCCLHETSTQDIPSPCSVHVED